MFFSVLTKNCQHYCNIVGAAIYCTKWKKNQIKTSKNKINRGKMLKQVFRGQIKKQKTMRNLRKYPMRIYLSL